MADAGFYRGTSAEQDVRFTDKQKKLLKTLKFGDNLTQKVDTRKVKMDVVKPWIARRVNEILGIEDDVVIEFIFSQLEERQPDARLMQINLTGFLNAKKAREFMEELWDLLLEAQNAPDGIPPLLVEMKKQELQLKQEEERVKEELRREEERIRKELEEAARREKKEEAEKKPVKMEDRRRSESRSKECERNGEAEKRDAERRFQRRDRKDDRRVFRRRSRERSPRRDRSPPRRSPQRYRRRSPTPPPRRRQRSPPRRRSPSPRSRRSISRDRDRDRDRNRERERERERDREKERGKNPDRPASPAAPPPKAPKVEPADGVEDEHLGSVRAAGGGLKENLAGADLGPLSVPATGMKPEPPAGENGKESEKVKQADTGVGTNQDTAVSEPTRGQAEAGSDEEKVGDGSGKKKKRKEKKKKHKKEKKAKKAKKEKTKKRKRHSDDESNSNESEEEEKATPEENLRETALKTLKKRKLEGSPSSSDTD